jgi:GT2 family glycosyltransferase
MQCLQSLKIQELKINYEVIVVDNSNGDNVEILNHFPEIKWLNMSYNSGFARANNAGIRMAKGSCILLLNPDTIAIDTSIEKCYSQLMESGFIGAGVQLLDEDHKPQISGNFFVKGGLNHLLPIPYYGDFIRWIGYKLQKKVPNIKQAKEVEEVDWISGAFLMVKKNAINKAGLLDEDFFLYAEEVEWCSRLRKVGRLCIYGNLHIIHLEGTTINQSQQLNEKGYTNLYDKKGLQLMVSNHLRVRKQYGVTWFLILLLNYILGLLVYFFGSFFHCLFTLRKPLADWEKVLAFGGNIIQLIRLSTKIIQNTPHFYKII